MSDGIPENSSLYKALLDLQEEERRRPLLCADGGEPSHEMRLERDAFVRGIGAAVMRVRSLTRDAAIPDAKDAEPSGDAVYRIESEDESVLGYHTLDSALDIARDLLLELDGDPGWIRVSHG